MSAALPPLSSRRSTISLERKELNLVDLLFNSQSNTKEASIYKKLQAQEERRESNLLGVSKVSQPHRSFRISHFKSRQSRQDESIMRKSLREKLTQVRERKHSFDKHRLTEKSRLKNLSGKRDTLRVISNEVNYLKSEVIDSLVGISSSH